MHQTDMIRYENDQHQCVAVVGVDVRLCSGFPEQRVLSLVESYNLTVEDVHKLFSLRYSMTFAPKFSSFRIFIISGLIVSVRRSLMFRILILTILRRLKS